MNQRFLILSITAILSLLQPERVEAQGIIIPAGDFLIVNGGYLLVGENWVNNGTFTHNAGTVLFNGTTQSIGGSAQTIFNNLTIASGSTTTITTSGKMVKNILLCNGTLNAGGYLTLLSTAAQTALIDGSGSGSVSGNVTMQRYLASGFGYKYFSSPFQSATVNEFSNDLNLNASFPALYRYDENQSSNGWVSYTNTSGALNPLQGYAANFGSSSAAKTVDMTGVVNNGTITSATLYNHNKTYTLGFNLAGNPYPSPIDWNVAGGWVKTNIDNSLYYFNASSTDQYSGTYSSYINGISSNGIASNMIAAMQGFFVHVSNGSYPVTGSLQVNNNARTGNGSTAFYRIMQPQDRSSLIRLHAGFFADTSLTDAAVFYFDNVTSYLFDKTKDALKLMNTSPAIPSLYALSTDAARMSITALPRVIDSAVKLPLGIKTDKDGWISFCAREIKDVPDRVHIYLNDAKTNTISDLRGNQPYQVYLKKGVCENRFYLTFSNKETELPVTNTETLRVYSTNGKLYVAVPSFTGTGKLVIANLQGQVLSQQQLSGSNLYTVNTPLSNGIYMVSLFTQQGALSKKVVISNP
jgi:hypothetical protein